MDESSVCSFSGLPKGIEVVSARSCKNLKTTKGLPASCKRLDLSFSAVETLEDIPETIEEIRLFNCYYLNPESLAKLSHEVRSKMLGVLFDKKEKTKVVAKQTKKSLSQEQKVNG